MLRVGAAGATPPNAAAGKIGAVGDAGSEAERGVILKVQVA